MEIKLYTTKDTPNTINKNKSLITAVYGNAIEPIDVSTPNVKIRVNETLLAANFAYIEKFKRFYFVKTMTIEKGFMNIQLEVDVLESFKTDILAYNGIIERQEFDYNLDIEDVEISAYSKKSVVYKKFPLKPLESNILEGEKKFVMITTSD